MNTVVSFGKIVFIIVNVTDEAQYSRKSEIVGYFTPICDDDHANHVLTFFPTSFVKIFNDSGVVDEVEKALQSFKDVDYNALLKGGGCNNSIPSFGFYG